MTLKLRGDHCQCSACGEHFNSTRAFDKHRSGTYAPMRRRCFTPAEMVAKGMALGTTGFWVASKRSILTFAPITGTAIVSNPCVGSDPIPQTPEAA